jgi:predicted ribosomally synthesized peptide with nif11-like leader
MIMFQMQELYEKVAKNGTLQAKFSKIMQEAETLGEEATREKLIAFAKEEGYDVTLEEMQTLFKDLAGNKEGALSDAELDMVAGGKSSNATKAIFISVASFGLGCAIGSAVLESMGSGRCGAVFQ